MFVKSKQVNNKSSHFILSHYQIFLGVDYIIGSALDSSDCLLSLRPSVAA